MPVTDPDLLAREVRPVETQELLRAVRQIEIRASRLVDDALAGEYVSVFRGRGMEFDEVREYVPGDDIRTIDWNVTARVGSPHVKRFVEERELTVVILVDASSSGRFGSLKRQKYEVAIEISAMLAFSAIRNKDKVGLMIFTDQVEKFIPPKKGRRHVLRLIRELIQFEPAHRGTDISEVLDYMGRVITRRTVSFLISDFIGEGFDRPLLLASKKHDLIAVAISDAREVEFPDVGFIELQDAETGERVLVDTHDRVTRDGYRRGQEETRDALADRFARIGVDVIPVRTDQPYIDPIVKFFKMRERRLRR